MNEKVFGSVACSDGYYKPLKSRKPHKSCFATLVWGLPRGGSLTTYGPNDFGSYKYIITEESGYSHTTQTTQQSDKVVVDITQKMVE